MLVAHAPNQAVLLALVLNPVEHEKLPFAVAAVRLEFPAVQPFQQFQDETIMDIRVVPFIMRINDDFVNAPAIDSQIQHVDAALALDFPYVGQVFLIERESLDKKSGEHRLK